MLPAFPPLNHEFSRKVTNVCGDLRRRRHLMNTRILLLLTELEELVRKEAEKEQEQKAEADTPMVFTEFDKELKFFKEEIEDLKGRM
jgi:hypothetical protein